MSSRNLITGRIFLKATDIPCQEHHSPPDFVGQRSTRRGSTLNFLQRFHILQPGFTQDEAGSMKLVAAAALKTQEPLTRFPRR
jgi:hypothetical protein